ncbi:hypothetical protein DB32_004286 [Sandaracinus amylolyticus]|uniref:Uncharacterized protein n=1 Tax=Sandaracinus amylolyticus TaxID=927083 RepID=A0A0F6W4B0_9BACT|nr:hypothetical protein DB32_004286 [Sandaracinus amylolyticus]
MRSEPLKCGLDRSAREATRRTGVPVTGTDGSRVRSEPLKCGLDRSAREAAGGRECPPRARTGAGCAASR